MTDTDGDGLADIFETSASDYIKDGRDNSKDIRSFINFVNNEYERISG